MTSKSYLTLALAGAAAVGWAAIARAEDKPILIGVTTAIQVQVGRDAIDATKLAIDEINAKGGVIGRKLAMVVADEGEAAADGPKVGIAAVNKLTGEDHVDVLLGGYDSGVTLGELPHIARAKTIFLGIGSASPAKQAKGLIDFIAGKLKGELGYQKISIIGENAKWVQDVVPALKKGAEDAGMTVPLAEFFDVQTADFSPLFAKVKDNGSQYLLIILSHAASDVFVKQWYDAKVPVPIGGIDVKGQDANFFDRVGGKSIAEVSTNFILRAPLTDKTVPFWDAFVKAYNRPPVYTAPGAYDAVYIYADAVARAKSADTDAVIKALEQTDFVGTRGRVVFDELHEVKDGPGFVNELFVQWQNDGKRVVVWPKELATGKMINPPWLV